MIGGGVRDASHPGGVFPGRTYDRVEMNPSFGIIADSLNEND